MQPSSAWAPKPCPHHHSNPRGMSSWRVEPCWERLDHTSLGLGPTTALPQVFELSKSVSRGYNLGGGAHTQALNASRKAPLLAQCGHPKSIADVPSMNIQLGLSGAQGHNFLESAGKARCIISMRCDQPASRLAGYNTVSLARFLKWKHHTQHGRDLRYLSTLLIRTSSPASSRGMVLAYALLHAILWWPSAC